jgi:stage V sporulation protein M
MKALLRLCGIYWDKLSRPSSCTNLEGGVDMKFYTIKLPKLVGGFVKAILNTFSKN